MEKTIQIGQTTAHRYERKFTVFNQPKLAVFTGIKKHPAFFREIYQPRQITNIYLDTTKFQFYKDNQIGIADRKKVRIRWYGNVLGKVSQPKLEYKIKVGLTGYKKIYTLPDFEIDTGFSKNEVQSLFDKANLPIAIRDELKGLKPTLLNTYQRTYFQSLDKYFRLTFDERLTYYQLRPTNNQFLAKSREKELQVLELKYAPEQEQRASQVASLLRYRLDKKSKYVSGIDSFRG
ncbi:MAG: VTC domain-containing protein [Saprospiraceae bacterium]